MMEPLKDILSRIEVTASEIAPHDGEVRVLHAVSRRHVMPDNTAYFEISFCSDLWPQSAALIALNVLRDTRDATNGSSFAQGLQPAIASLEEFLSLNSREGTKN